MCGFWNLTWNSPRSFLRIAFFIGLYGRVGDKEALVFTLGDSFAAGVNKISCRLDTQMPRISETPLMKEKANFHRKSACSAREKTQAGRQHQLLLIHVPLEG